MSDDHWIPLPLVDGTLTVAEALDLESQHNPAKPVYLFEGQCVKKQKMLKIIPLSLSATRVITPSDNILPALL